jgi:hypothetical protein
MDVGGIPTTVGYASAAPNMCLWQFVRLLADRAGSGCSWQHATMFHSLKELLLFV